MDFLCNLLALKTILFIMHTSYLIYNREYMLYASTKIWYGPVVKTSILIRIMLNLKYDVSVQYYFNDLQIMMIFGTLYMYI